MSEEYFIDEAFRLANKSKDLNEIPVGVVIVYKNKIIGRGFNNSINTANPMGHAEINAIKEASNYIKNWRLDECTLYTTLEPCIMCYGCITYSRIKKVVYLARDKEKGILSVGADAFNKSVLKTEFIHDDKHEKKSSELLKGFFKDLRKKNSTN